MGLLAGFRQAHGGVKVKAVLADALYGSADFMDAASQIFGGVQVVSQLHCNQNITYKGKRRKSQIDVLLAFIKRALEHPDPAGMLNSLAQMIGDVFKLMPSEKHLSGRLGAHGVYPFTKA
ncbi:hypothetical protein KFZ76_17050 [Methylovulum psychrotolerans]|uniref:hypothetical protein n=1 Tax=Methylovulum psychrotolerans TaxID=1704499 RepID=UPI001BFF19CF|nr:hypothetical protein [Methylovulum psychrotolerans]MBT9099405.1 hypothetical protein [Methylovulum psychrotolerans]